MADLKQPNPNQSEPVPEQSPESTDRAAAPAIPSQATTARLQLAAIIESSDDAILSKDLNGIIQSWNRGAQRIYGYSREEIIGKHISVLTPSAAADDTPHIMGRLQRGERIDHYETVRKTKDGRLLNMSLTISPVRDESGTIIGASTVGRDITEPKRTQDELRKSQKALEQSELRFRSLVQNSSDVITILAPDGTIRYESPSLERVLGFKPEELVGKNVFDFVHPDDRGEVSHVFRERLKVPGLVPRIELRFQHKDGGWRALEATGNNLLHLPSVAGVVVNSRDISERKRTEEVLNATEKLATTGRLAAAIAHEINNPLEAVTNLLYLLESHPSLDVTARRFARMAQDEVARVARLARQTLAFYREPAQPVEVNLAELLGSLLELYEHKLQSRQIDVTKRFETEAPITASPGEIRQVLSNLITNAMEATPDGGSIKVHLFPSRDWRHPGQRGVRILVADTGHGILPENRARVFEPFFTTKGEKGTGLGLWVSYGIVQKYGGTIHVRSSVREGRSGTCFSVFFPVASTDLTIRKPAARVSTA